MAKMAKQKSINKITSPMTAWDCAGLLFGNDKDAALASEALRQMVKAGWTFLHYNDDGQEVWKPPK